MHARISKALLNSKQRAGNEVEIVCDTAAQYEALYRELSQLAGANGEELAPNEATFKGVEEGGETWTVLLKLKVTEPEPAPAA